LNFHNAGKGMCEKKRLTMPEESTTENDGEDKFFQIASKSPSYPRNSSKRRIKNKKLLSSFVELFVTGGKIGRTKNERIKNIYSEPLLLNIATWVWIKSFKIWFQLRAN
jgi:hypothetical protein